jgi:hypothetical protein
MAAKPNNQSRKGRRTTTNSKTEQLADEASRNASRLLREFTEDPDARIELKPVGKSRIIITSDNVREVSADDPPEAV